MSEQLGSREIDKTFNPSSARRKYRKHDIKFYTDFLKLVKKTSVRKPFRYMRHLKPLSICQKKCMEEVVTDLIRSTKKKNYKLAVISGMGGTGKTNLWMSICSLMQNEDVEFVVLSPVASNCASIGAVTIHSWLALYNIRKPYDELVTENIHKATRERISKCQVVCIDEAFLTGSRLFSCLVRRIALIKNKNFEGNVTIDSLPCSIIMSG